MPFASRNSCTADAISATCISVAKWRCTLSQVEASPQSPGVKRLTRPSCPLLNCESVLWGVEAGDQCLRRSPPASTKRNQNLVHAGCRGRNLHDQKWTHRDLLCLSLDRRNWSRSWPGLKQTPDAIPPQCVASSRRLLSRRSIGKRGIRSLQSANPFRRVQDGISGVRYQESRRPPTATFAWEPHPDSLGLTV
jgi:hypothetical protein